LKLELEKIRRTKEAQPFQPQNRYPSTFPDEIYSHPNYIWKNRDY